MVYIKISTKIRESGGDNHKTLMKNSVSQPGNQPVGQQASQSLIESVRQKNAHF